jgi:IS30 family transposase
VRGHRKRKSKGIGRKERKTKIPNRIPIEERPVSVESRSRFGHWEGDSLVSRKSLAALNSLVERKSRLLFLSRLERKSAELTKDAVLQRLQGLPEKARRTLTLDNGTENAQHEAITDAIGMQCYFARPYASWQRGTNESVNGLVRRYFPKGTDFSKITDVQVAKVESLINNRPRKCLGYKTPLEVASAFVALRP